jgi:hypothetical protein
VTTVTRHRRERRPKRRWPRRLAWVLALLVVLAVGIAIGQALHDNPRPGETTTQEKTLTLRPESATVTVTTP